MSMTMPGVLGKPTYSQMVVETRPGRWEVVSANGQHHQLERGVTHVVGAKTVVKPLTGEMKTYGELKKTDQVPSSLSKLVAPSHLAQAHALHTGKQSAQTHTVTRLGPGEFPPGHPEGIGRLKPQGGAGQSASLGPGVGMPGAVGTAGSASIGASGAAGGFVNGGVR